MSCLVVVQSTSLESRAWTNDTREMLPRKVVRATSVLRRREGEVDEESVDGCMEEPRDDGTLEDRWEVFDDCRAGELEDDRLGVERVGEETGDETGVLSLAGTGIGF